MIRPKYRGFAGYVMSIKGEQLLTQCNQLEMVKDQNRAELLFAEHDCSIWMFAAQFVIHYTQAKWKNICKLGQACDS